MLFSIFSLFTVGTDNNLEEEELNVSLKWKKFKSVSHPKICANKSQLKLFWTFVSCAPKNPTTGSTQAQKRKTKNYWKQ